MQPVLGAKHVFLAVAVLAVVQGARHHHQWDMSPSFQSLGPTIHAEQGDTVVVTIRNTDLGDNVAIHIHWDEQNIATARADETTAEPIPPGGTITYEFVVDRPGTFTYHVYHGRDPTA
ncbi:hypothetical protein D1007_16280 [Hordeum vulgare]|nr:hypothetical protein D1007_16280 [Hordeum vulgare]